MDGLKKKIRSLIGLWVIFCMVMICVTIHGCSRMKDEMPSSQEVAVLSTQEPAATSVPTPTPTSKPVPTPVTTSAPVPVQTPIPTEGGTMMPTETPTEAPTEAPMPTSTVAPTSSVAPAASVEPTPAATQEPAVAPIVAPTSVPTPTHVPQTEVCPSLSVSGTKLVDESGNQVQLRGVSTHGIAWFPDYVNEDFFRQLKQEWGANVVRLAMYTAEHGGYCAGGDKEALKELIRDGVEYATNQGLYVIIDWHILSDGNPNTHLEESKAFFEEMAESYADYTNVIYEICNEPNGGTTWSQVKEYAEQIIAVIREKDEDGIILVGTPNWCQYVEQAAADPITDAENIMYTLHFYAATHKESLRNSMVSALEAGLPLFVSEYGICDASGSGSIDAYQAEEWVKLMDEYQVSYVAWNLSNKAETSASFRSDCKKISGFTTEDLSSSGKWVYEILRERAGNSGMQAPDPAAPTAIPDKQEEPTTEPTAAPTEVPENGESSDGQASTSQSAAGMTYVTSVVNSWEQDGKSCAQYTLTITNESDEPVNGWSVSLPFEQEFVVTDSWNGNFQTEGNVLTITPKDYNSGIPAEGSIGDIGFILQFS